MKEQMPVKCKVKDCYKPSLTTGYCHGHYKRLLRYGKAEAPKEICKECGTVFTIRRIGQLFCKRRCKEKWRNRLPKARAAQREREKRFRVTEKGKEHMRKSARRMYQKYRHKAIARAMVQHAVRKGELAKPSCCTICGSTEGKIEAHHHKGYTKENWLNVKWLCKRCHVKEEKKNEVS